MTKNRFDDIDQTTMDMFGETAADAATRSFQYVKLVAPKEGDPPDLRLSDIIVTDEQAIALADKSSMGWVRYGRDNKPVEEHFIPTLGNKKPKRPNSFRDDSKWDKWPNGKSKDPWNFQAKMPLTITTGELAGKTVIFNGKNEGTLAAIGDVQSAFAEKRRRPLVKLTVVKRDYENVYDPVLQILSFTDDDSTVRGLNLAKDEGVVAVEEQEPLPTPLTNGASAAGVNADMGGDDIPFGPEFR